MSWWRSLDAIPIVRAMRQRAEVIRARELSRALGDMPDLDQDQIEVVDALTRSIVNKMLHDPTKFLKRPADKSQLKIARDLFGLRGEAESIDRSPGDSLSMTRRVRMRGASRCANPMQVT